MDLRIKRIYEPPARDDGARILVDRLWPRGIGKDDAKLTFWLKEIAPSTELRTWFHSEPTQWAEFRRRYRAELDANTEAIDRLRGFLKKGRVTLLYAVRDTERNHARILAEYLGEKGG
jgi:uncharacterized protein YeaO (DUF488 family)